MQLTDWLLGLRRSSKNRLLGRRGQRRKSLRGHDRAQTLSVVESLEDRVMLTANVSLLSGVLTITGENIADTISIRYGDDSHSTVDVLRSDTIEVVSFDTSDINSITVRGRRGDDTIINETSIAATVYGGKGNDTFIGTGSTSSVENVLTAPTATASITDLSLDESDSISSDSSDWYAIDLSTVFR